MLMFLEGLQAIWLKENIGREYDDTELIHNVENKDEESELIQRHRNSASIVKESFIGTNAKDMLNIDIIWANLGN